MLGLIQYNQTKDNYELVAASAPQTVIVKSKNAHHLDYYVRKQKHDSVVAAGITEYEIVSTRPNETDKVVLARQVTGPTAAPRLAPTPQVSLVDQYFTLDEKFELMEELVSMVIRKEVSSMIIAGRGGIGKTHTVMSLLNAAGLLDVATVTPSIEELRAAELQVADDTQTMVEKIYMTINRPHGDYIVVKGKATPKALYRLLFENRKRLIVFDDCDSILQSDDAVSMLKTALDNGNRYVSWRSESPFGDGDLPPSFKFEGTIICITNMELHEVDEAIRTRAFKVDISMTPLQRIERMRSVLKNVLPEIELEAKEDALGVLEENVERTDDINFRSLIKTIQIRQGTSKNWRSLAKYSLLVGAVKK